MPTAWPRTIGNSGETFAGSPNRAMTIASFDRIRLLIQLRFASFAMVSVRRDLHPQECAHAGRIRKRRALLRAFRGRLRGNQTPDAYATVFTISSMTFFASPKTIIVLSM